MKRALIAAALLVSLIGSAMVGFVGGRMVASSESELARIVESVRVNGLVTSDLASTDVVTREAALWYQAASVQYGTDTLVSTLGDAGRTRQLMLAYARLAEHASTHQSADRTELLLKQAEKVCARSKVDPCSRADILAFLKRLNQVSSPATQ